MCLICGTEVLSSYLVLSVTDQSNVEFAQRGDSDIQCVRCQQTIPVFKVSCFSCMTHTHGSARSRGAGGEGVNPVAVHRQ